MMQKYAPFPLTALFPLVFPRYMNYIHRKHPPHSDAGFACDVTIRPISNDKIGGNNQLGVTTKVGGDKDYRAMTLIGSQMQT